MRPLHVHDDRSTSLVSVQHLQGLQSWRDVTGLSKLLDSMPREISAGGGAHLNGACDWRLWLCCPTISDVLQLCAGLSESWYLGRRRIYSICFLDMICIPLAIGE